MDNTTKMILEIMQTEEEENEVRIGMGAAYLYHQRQGADSSPHQGGSIMNHRMIDRSREQGHARLYRDYFSDTPSYTETQLRRRFRMRTSLFLRIEKAKVTAALRMLAYGTAADAVDDYVRIGESTTIESLKRFVEAIVEVFGAEYLRGPNDEDVARLLAENEQRGFPGILGSIDCMHWKWKNCPTAWQDLAESRGPEMGYYVADGIYPSWPTFFKSISKPLGNKRKYFANAQESVRKDVERAFGVLQSRFAMICGPSRFWDVSTMKYIMTSCIILHNMIIEDEREINTEEENFDTNEEPTFTRIPRHQSSLAEFLKMHEQIRDKQVHVQLQNDLVEHLWQIHGGGLS
ncbi:uncharacterized protein LOC141718979 [Apium graveolens]|uniref:uncharacterized protein LOC141718979 n=1 Tax=Apium graveolens TaxID=4045 RepID=UPI003D7B39B4